MTTPDAPAELDLRDYAAVLWRRKWIVALAVVVVTAAAAAFSFTQTDRFRSEASVIVRQPVAATSLGGEGIETTERSLANEVRLAEGPDVIDAVRERVGPGPELSVSVEQDADVLVFSATSTDAALAAEAANAHVETFLVERRETRVDELLSSSDIVRERIDEIEAELAQLDAQRAAEVNAIPFEAEGRDAQVAAINADYEREAAVLEGQRDRYTDVLDELLVSAQLAEGAGAPSVQPADPATSPYAPTPQRDIALALVLGLMLGVGAAFLLEYLDTSLRSEEDLTAAAGIPNLAVVPRLKGWKKGDHPHVITREDPQSAAAEAYRSLRTAIQFMAIDRTMSTVQFTSPRPGDGKTTTAANMAVAVARAGQRVVLVDCDLRKPMLHAYFDLTNDYGFTSVLLGETHIEDVARPISGESNLLVIPSGPVPPDPSELLSGERARSILRGVAERADMLLIDSPPVLAVSDPLVLSGVADGVVLVASAASTDRGQVSRAVEQLRQVDAPLLGTVLNQYAARDLSTYGYSYGAYGTYGTYGAGTSPNGAGRGSMAREVDPESADRR